MAATPSDGGMAVHHFAYHRSLGPMLGVLLGLAIAESFVVHIIAMAVWGWKIATVLTLIDLSVVVAIVRLLRSFKRLPVTIVGDRITFRAGVRSIEIGLSDIAGFRREWDAQSLKAPGMLNLALIAWPNVVLDLKQPVKVRHRRNVVAIAHRLDDPVAFHAAIASLERAGADRRPIAGT